MSQNICYTGRDSPNTRKPGMEHGGFSYDGASYGAMLTRFFPSRLARYSA
jgi:hypothetical protein